MWILIFFLITLPFWWKLTSAIIDTIKEHWLIIIHWLCKTVWFLLKLGLVLLAIGLIVGAFVYIYDRVNRTYDTIEDVCKYKTSLPSKLTENAGTGRINVISPDGEMGTLPLSWSCDYSNKFSETGYVVASQTNIDKQKRINNICDGFVIVIPPNLPAEERNKNQNKVSCYYITRHLNEYGAWSVLVINKKDGRSGTVPINWFADNSRTDSFSNEYLIPQDPLPPPPKIDFDTAIKKFELCNKATLKEKKILGCPWPF